MSDPLALVPFAVAAGGGTIDGLSGSSLVAAGVALLQRSAALVRALAGRRSAIVLPPGPAFLVALAASDGRESVVLDPDTADGDLGTLIERFNIGAIFTLSSLGSAVTPDVPVVLMDLLPSRAVVQSAGESRTLDLGSHFGLALEGSSDTEGSTEPFILHAKGRDGDPWTHREVLSEMRESSARFGFCSADRVAVALPFAESMSGVTLMSAAMRAGASVVSLSAAASCVAQRAKQVRVNAAAILIEAVFSTTVVVGDAAFYHAFLAAHTSAPLHADSPTSGSGWPAFQQLRHAIVVGGLPDAAMPRHFLSLTGCSLARWQAVRDRG